MKKLVALLLICFPGIIMAQSVENGSFESWENEGLIEEPVDWSSIQTALPNSLASFAPEVMTKSTDAQTGTYSVRLENIEVIGVVANGVVTNGRVYANLNPTQGYMQSEIFDTKYSTPCTYRPDSLVGYFKYTPAGADLITVEVLLHTGTAKLPDTDSTNFIGYAVYNSTNSTFSNWTRFSVPIDYTNPGNPEYVLIILNAGNKFSAVDGSVAYFDDISLVGSTVGITQPLLGNTINVYAAQNQINVSARQVEYGITYHLMVHNVLGKLMHQSTFSGGTDYQIDNLHRGLYICNLVDDRGNVITRKVVVQ